ncbi:manganese superoxide dismutase [Pisolithus albus]|nr:manganese superoxide dismutase [Pisolithus albus]
MTPIPHYTLPRLPYPHDHLEPSISEEIMELHHFKHHQAYIDALNKLEVALAKLPTSNHQDRIALQPAYDFNMGGHVNHSFFWRILAPYNEHSDFEGDLRSAIIDQFGSVEDFKKKFKDVTLGIQGSGWGWLGYSLFRGRLEIVTTANQDPLLSHVSIIGVDVWEHAFYLQYKNLKGNYLDNIWKVINYKEADYRFKNAEELFKGAKQPSEGAK